MQPHCLFPVWCWGSNPGLKRPRRALHRGVRPPLYTPTRFCFPPELKQMPGPCSWTSQAPALRTTDTFLLYRLPSLRCSVTANRKRTRAKGKEACICPGEGLGPVPQQRLPTMVTEDGNQQGLAVPAHLTGFGKFQKTGWGRGPVNTGGLVQLPASSQPPPSPVRIPPSVLSLCEPNSLPQEPG